MSLAVLLCGCADKNEYKGLEKPLANAQPNEAVVSNGGLACRQGDWIYYINGDNFTRHEGERFHEYAGALCRMKVSGEEKDVVVNKDVSLFNIVGDTIYLCVFEKGSSYIAKVKLDGTNYVTVEKIDDIYSGGCYAFKNGYIYYTKDYKLHQITPEGEKKQITEFEIYNARVCDEYLYFTREISGEIGSVYKMKHQDSGFVEVTKEPAYVLDCFGDVAYYYMMGTGNVYEYSAKDGKAKIVVYAGYTDYLFDESIDGYVVSYTLESEEEISGTFLIPSGGGQKKQISQHSGRCMTYYNGYVYYVNVTKLNNLYRCTLDGTVDECISEEFVYDYDTLDVVDNYLYFLSDSDYDRIYRVNMDTSEVECVEFEDISSVG